MRLPSRLRLLQAHLHRRDGEAPSAWSYARVGLLIAAFVAGCGGGVDSGGTGSPASAFASGPITGFGSIIVDGVHFDDRVATVSDLDGNLRSRDDLRLGMTADVRGSALGVDADGNDVSTATSIVFGSEIRGPVSASNLAARTLTALGQTIDIATTTVFDAGLVGGQAALAVGDVVEVYGHDDVATGHYAATRVERKAAVATFALRGLVSALDTATKTFSIGAARISYAGLSPGGIPATLANDRFFRVLLGLAPVAGTWNAVGISDGSPVIDNRQEARLKGLVSAFTSNAQFSVNGTPVDARAALFPNGTAGLGLGTRVEVQGSTTEGVLVASSVKVVNDDQTGGQDFDVRGDITALDATAKTFVVHDVTVSYSGTVDFRDGSASDLALGRQVEARGMLSVDGTLLQASRIDFKH